MTSVIMGNTVFSDYVSTTPGPNHYQKRGEQQSKLFKRAPQFTLKGRSEIVENNKFLEDPHVDPAFYTPIYKYLSTFEQPKTISLSDKFEIRPNSNPAPNAYSVKMSQIYKHSPHYTHGRKYGDKYIPYNRNPGPADYRPRSMQYEQIKTNKYKATFRRDTGWRVFIDVIENDKCQTGPETGPANYEVNRKHTIPQSPIIKMGDPVPSHLMFNSPKNNYPSPALYSYDLDTVFRKPDPHVGCSFGGRFRRGAFVK